MNFINNWLRDDIQNIDAYHIHNSANKIKLDAMESPFILPDKLIERYLTYLQDNIAKTPLNRYPSGDANQLKQTLRELMNIPDEAGILLGNGSDELIQLLALACDNNASILSVEPSFVMYQMIAKFTRLDYQHTPLTDNFEIDLKRTLADIKTHKPQLIFIAYPNNPTANLFAADDIIKIIQATNALVVLDEAYYLYAHSSFLSFVRKYPNLLVMRSVSKIGFAGLRLGLLIGSQATINQLDKLRLPYNISTLTQISANFLLQQKAEIQKNAQIIINQRTFLFSALNLIKSLTVYPSQANFILFKAENADSLFAHLKTDGVLIKNFTNAPRLTDYLRVTVGNEEENAIFINSISKYYSL